MSNDPQRLAEECRGLARLFVRSPIETYAVEKYVDAHCGVDRFDPVDRFDALLVRAACGSAFLRRPAASYARLLEPRGALQRKLVLLLSILESSVPAHRTFDAALPGGWPGMIVILGVRSIVSLVALIFGVVFFGPASVVLSRK